MRLKDWVEKNKHNFLENDLKFVLKNVFRQDLVSLMIENPLLSKYQKVMLDKIKRMYKKKMPLSYILGEEEFFGYKFFVTKNVLSPRFSTEVIVEEAIEIIQRENSRNILDLGCGCGNIAISIAKQLQEKRKGEPVKIFASDISFKALEVCKVNRNFHRVNIRLVNTDLLKGFKPESFDMVVTNPPYVEEEYIKNLPYLKYEPEIALLGGKDGLSVIRRILREVYIYLKKMGIVVMEMGSEHKPRLEKIINEGGIFKIEKWVRDYNGQWRGVVLRRYKK